MSSSSSIAACYENHLNWKMIVSCTRDIILYYLLFFLTVYATYQSVPLKISRIALPTRFTSSPYIEDFSNGQLLTTQNKVAFSEISFVLYYAPWCAESKIARKIYENIANVYGNRIFFSSINCWQPGGECRIQYSNVPNWPTIMSYRSTGFGLQFNGPLSERSLLNFVDSLMYPMKRIAALDDLFMMMNTHNIVVLAILNMKRDQRQFKAFYQASLKYLETDPYREIGFAICTGESSKMFGAKDYPKIRIYLWNETLEYSQPSWQAANILKYIKNSVHHLQKWLSPNGKSNAISSQFTMSSLMLVFTPRTYSLAASSYYNMFRQIGHIYHNCLNDSWVKDMTNQHFTKYHGSDLQNLVKLQEDCKNISKDFVTFKNTHCADEFSLANDDRIPKNLIVQNLFYKCKALDFDENFVLNFTMENFTKLEEISGLSCITNKSSSTVVLDSFTYEIFARQLGIELKDKPFKTAVAILNDEDETVYVMNKTINLDNIVEFLKKYSYGSLTNFKRSIVGLPTPFTISKKPKYESNSKISIAEVSSELLMRKILQFNKTTIVFIHSAQCNFCNLMSHYLLSISNTLRSLTNVEFLRVDGDKNDFNVNYGQEGFPLLILYPQNRKTESVIFPSKLKVSKQNLISFILTNLPKSSKIHGIALFCKNLSRISYLNRCSNVLRSEVHDVIEKSLQTWRNDNRTRVQMYEALVLLRSLYFQLININSEEYDDIEFKIKKISLLWNKFGIF